MAPRVRIGRSRVPDLCAQTGKTQAALADFLEVTEGYVSQVASSKSKTKFSVVQMKNAAIFFGCLMDDLVEWVYK